MYSTRALWCLLQIQSSRDAAPQRPGYCLAAPTGTAGLAAADVWNSADSMLHLHEAAQGAGMGSRQQAQAPAQASTAQQGHLSSGMSGHAALPARAAPAAAPGPAPPAPGAFTLPDSLEEGQSRAQSQTLDGVVADPCSHSGADVPAQQALRVPVAALQHAAADWQRADMLTSLAGREVPAPQVQRPVSRMRPLTELHYTNKVGPDLHTLNPKPWMPHLPCYKVLCDGVSTSAWDDYGTGAGLLPCRGA